MKKIVFLLATLLATWFPMAAHAVTVDAGYMLASESLYLVCANLTETRSDDLGPGGDPSAYTRSNAALACIDKTGNPQERRLAKIPILKTVIVGPGAIRIRYFWEVGWRVA